MPRGNVRLTTRNANGQVVTYFWIESIGTDLDLMMREGQRKGGQVHQAIRLQERFLQFTCVYNPHAPSGSSTNTYPQFTRALSEHWRTDLSTGQAEPMKLLYFGTGRTYRGFIESWKDSAMWNEVVYRYDFRMRLVMRDEKGARIVGFSPYVPYRGDVEEWGPSWFTAKELKASWQTYQPQSAFQNPTPDDRGRRGRNRRI